MKICKVNNCGKKHKARGFCSTHYLESNPRKCNIEGCKKGHRARGFCYNHYIEFIRLQIMDILGGRECIKCGFSDKRALQFDHINGGGIKELRQMSPPKMYLYYLNNPNIAKKKLQLLCANCNWIKRHENKEFNNI